MRRKWNARRVLALALSASLLFSGGCAAAQTGAKSTTKPVDTETFGVRAVLTNEKRDRIRVETAVPVFSGFLAANELNQKIEKLNDDGVAQLKADTADIAPGSCAGADELYYGSFFDYSRNGDVLSIWVTSENYSGGAHGMHWITSYTVNTRTGKFYTPLSSLFRSPEAGVQKITGGILKKINAQPDVYLPNAEQAAQTVKDKKGDYKYYLDGGNLVVYFDLYELQCYAAGIPTYVFPVRDLDLDPKLSSLPPLGKVRSNGTGIEFQDPVCSDDSGVYLPLEDTAAVLGHTLTKTNVNYAVDGRAVKIKNMRGKAYAPLEFFTGTLGDFIIYDGEVLRFFRSADHAGFQDSGNPSRAPVVLGQY